MSVTYGHCTTGGDEAAVAEQCGGFEIRTIDIEAMGWLCAAPDEHDPQR